MDLTLVDATEAAEVEVGDEAVLIGKQGDLEIKSLQAGDLTSGWLADSQTAQVRS